MSKLVYQSEMGSRTAKVFKLEDGPDLAPPDDGEFEVVCMIGEQCSRAFPVKTLKTRKGAITRAHKFLNA